VVPEHSAPRPVAAAPFAAPPLEARSAVREQIKELERDPTGDQDRRLAIAFEACQDLYFVGTPLEALELAVKLLGDLVPCEAVSGCLYDINTDEFRFVALSGAGALERRAEAVPSSAGLLSAAVRSGRESFVVNAVEGDARYDAAIDGRIGLAVTNLAYLPLQKSDHLLGILQLLNRQGRQGFGEADMAVAGYVAAQVAEFLSTRRGGSERRGNGGRR
jgi:GAF domain-containing protein